MPRLLVILLAVPLLSFAQVQSAPDDPGVTVDPGASLQHRAPVHFPKDTIVAGTVEIEARLNTDGEVADARVLSGPEELRKESLWSVLQWHYSPSAVAPVHVSIRFVWSGTSPRPVTIQPGSAADVDFLSGILKTIWFSGFSVEAENDLRSRLPLHDGDPVHHSDLAKIDALVREFDEHLSTDVSGQIAAPDAHRDLTIHIHAAAPRPAVLNNSADAQEKPRPGVKK